MYKIVQQILFQAQPKQECMHYRSGHQTTVLCIYYSAFIEMTKLVSVLVIDTKKIFINSA